MEQKSLRSNDQGIDLIDLLIVLAKRKKMIVGVTLGAAIVMAAISLIMPKIYMAETKIMPPQQSSSMASQLQTLGQVGTILGIAGGSLGVKSPGDLYVGLLKSRTVLDRVIDRFDLMKLYDEEYRQDARKKLLKRLSVLEDKKSGLITVGVEDNDPKRSADMANAFIEELRALNKGLSVSEAAQRRLFFEEQLKDSRISLSKSEEAMKTFQEKTGAIKVDAQATAAIEGISRLRAQIASREVQVRVMRTYATAQNPDVLRADEELKGLKEQLARLESKSSGYNPIVPTGAMPSVGTEYIRKLRDLKFNETLYELLLKQFEAAKLDEAKDATVIQVVEKAAIPERKVRPKRALLVILVAFAALLFSVVAAFVMEYAEKASGNPETRDKLAVLKKYVTAKMR